MKKIIILAVFILILIAVAGVFLWQDQKDVRELNKNLPKGVKVVKSLIGQEYKVVNKIDGYEFKVPKDWKGIEEIKYYKEEEGGQGITGLSLEGFRGEEKSLGIVFYRLNQSNTDLENWVKEKFQKFGLSESIRTERNKIGDFDTIKVTAEEYFSGFAWYFFMGNKKIYEIDNISEGFFREIIANGQW